MHGICSNTITCAARGCVQAATVTVKRQREPEPITLAVDGRTFWMRFPAVEIDYCERCADRLDL